MAYSFPKLALTASILAAILMTATAVSAEDWVAGGGGSCIAACKNAGARAVVSGQYKQLPSEDQSFAVCRTTGARTDGRYDRRSGFNIVSSGATCRVAIGDDGAASREYDCLCIN